MSVAPTKTCDVPVLPPAVTGIGMPVAFRPDDHSWFGQAASAQLLVLDAVSASGFSVIYASPAGAEFPGLTAWPTNPHAVIRWSRTMGIGVVRLASALVPISGEAGATADMLSFLFPKARPRSARLEALIARIIGFGELAPDWAGGEATAISAATIGAAMRVAEAAERAGLSLPQASPSPEGEISLSWYRGRDRFALTIEQDMHAVWATSINREVEAGDAVEIGSLTFPGLIVGALREFYGSIAAEVPM